MKLGLIELNRKTNSALLWCELVLREQSEDLIGLQAGNEILEFYHPLKMFRTGEILHRYYGYNHQVVPFPGVHN